MLSDEHHTVTSVGPVKEKARCSKVFDFVKGMRKTGVRIGAKLSGWTVDSQEFRTID